MDPQISVVAEESRRQEVSRPHSTFTIEMFL